MGVRCFLVTDTGRDRLTLRRYCSSDTAKCSGPMSYHNADGPVIAIIDTTPFKTEDGYVSLDAIERQHRPPTDDPRWPVKCDGCDYRFTSEDAFQLFSDSIWIDAQGREHSLRDRTPGMMWDAHWAPEQRKGPDGKSLVVVCPGGHEWNIDGRSSNCTKKDDVGPYGKAHRCWVRHGEPPNITVDKSGLTCSAGGGSIQAGSYHGFLRNGEFT